MRFSRAEKFSLCVLPPDQKPASTAPAAIDYNSHAETLTPPSKLLFT
jgi:hypothetical protein